MRQELQESHASREEAADRLERIAQDLRDGDSFDVEVGNRTIHLSPPEEIAMEVRVREKASRLRGDRESVTITFDWKPE